MVGLPTIDETVYIAGYTNLQRLLKTGVVWLVGLFGAYGELGTPATLKKARDSTGVLSRIVSYGQVKEHRMLPKSLEDRPKSSTDTFNVFF